MPLKTASIVHNDDDYRDPQARRVTLTLIEHRRYVWTGPDGDTPAQGATEEEAMKALLWAYGEKEWNLKIDD